MQEAYAGLFPLVWIVIPGSLFLSLRAWRSGCYHTLLTHHPLGPTDTAVPVRDMINI